MKRIRIAALLTALLMIPAVTAAGAENTAAPSIRDMVIAENEKKPFSFRNGITWGMNTQQVSLIEDIPMEQRSSSEWSVMVTAEPVAVSRFHADLVYMFYQDALRMITYEFQKDCSTLNFQYLTGALCSLYGDSREASPLTIKGWMDRIYQNYYTQELIHNAQEWIAEDGTSVYLYYYSETAYAILYVCPTSGGSSYNTDGL